jgi:hypothetical protein
MRGWWGCTEALAESTVIESAARRAPSDPPAVSSMAARSETASSRRTESRRPGSRFRNGGVRLSLALVATFVAVQLFAGSASAPMQVSVTVLARAVLTVASQPSAVIVTEADIARGYIDVSTPIVVQVRTNSRAGYILQADRRTADFATVELAFGDATMTVADGESWISRPYVPGGDVIAMQARVHLGAGMQPGSYPLPIALSARPL